MSISSETGHDQVKELESLLLNGIETENKKIIDFLRENKVYDHMKL